MPSILMADVKYLYDYLSEVEDELSDRHISAYKENYLILLQKQINIEIRLHNLNMTCKNCYYRKYDNGINRCAALGGVCLPDKQGESLDLCQKARMTYIETTS